MTDNRRIRSVRFIVDGMKYKALAVLDDNCTKPLFLWYPAEFTFTPDELVGLTVSEAVALHAEREETYLSS